MKKAIRMVLAGLLAVAGTTLLSEMSWADEGTAVSHDITVKVVPTGSTLISISTHIVDMGPQSLGSEVVIATPVVITNGGTLGIDLQITGNNLDIAATGNVWTLQDSDPTGTANVVRLQAILNGATEPAGGAFSDNVDDALSDASLENMTTALHAGTENGDDVAVSGTRTLWFKIGMPLSSDSSEEHLGTVTITATGTGTF